MPAAVNSNEFHLHFGTVAPEYLLYMNSVSNLGLLRFRGLADVVELCKILN